MTATEAFAFRGAGDYALAGRLEVPDGPARAWAIMAHCFTCGKDGLAAVRITRALARAGIGTLRFDFAGLGESGGSFGDGSFANDVQDLEAAGEAMRAADRAPALLIGHSLGGAAVLAAEIASVRAVATIGAPFDLAHVLRQFDETALATIEREGVADVTLGGRSFAVSQSLIAGLHDQDQAARIAHLHRALLVMHAPLDETVGLDQATQIFSTARHPKSFVSLDTADHLLTRKADANYAASIIVSWASRYLPAASA